jgi:DNA polymerase-3 subunit gamma/tau
MAYQTLYLKYRSQTFADLVGQDAIARTLQNAVAQERVAHAYLFSGVRGTGKTSTARILARAINCLNRQGSEPCGVCSACVEIGTGAAVDLIEIDAASNRGIDEIRDLREKVKYLPASLRVKVYIIDEAHMLTTEAFNALLKTLEEPPAHVVFVLATTEPHKIPLTVASRCQRFDFRRIDGEAIAARLARIVSSEGVVVEPAVLQLLARLARGSMRDGITLLEQVMGQDGELTLERARELLGLADPKALTELVGAAVAGDAAAVLGRLQQFYDAGGDVRQLVRGLLSVIREAALRSVGYRETTGDGFTEAGSDGVESQLERIGRMGGRQLLLDLWKGLMEMEPELRKGADARLLLEVTLLQRIGGGTAVQPSAARTEQPAATAKSSTSGRAAPKPVAVAAEEGARPAAATAGGVAHVPAGDQPPAAVAAAETAAALPPGAAPRWEILKQKLTRPVASLLNDARLVQATDELVRLEFKFPTHLEMMQKPDKREKLVLAAREVFGPSVRVEMGAATEAANSGGQAPAQTGGIGPKASPGSIADDPLVRDAMNRFDVASVRVVPKGR